MSVTRIEFPVISAALYFLHRACPANPSLAWSFLDCFTMVTFHNSQVVVIDYDNKISQILNVALVESCGGKTITKSLSGYEPAESIPLTELFRHTPLEASTKTESGRCFLIVPDKSSPDSIGELIAQISSLEGFSVWVREIKETEKDKRKIIFELRVEGEDVSTAPSGLVGAPQLLIALNEEIYVPFGFETPLLPAYRFLFPATNGTYVHTWQFDKSGDLAYKVIALADEPPIPLARLVLLPQNELHDFTETGVSLIKIPLRLRPIHTRRQVSEVEKILYTFETRGGELGPLFLRLLDHTEAGIESFTYFNRLAGSGPNSVIIHYILLDAKLADEDMWPELRRYVLPHSHAEAGLPIFIPADFDFSPSLDGILRGLDGNDEFLTNILEAVGFEKNQQGRIVLIDNGPSETGWNIAHLDNGRPLKSLIEIVLDEYNREPVRRVIDITRIDLTEDRAKYEKQWIESGKEESEELEKATEILAAQLHEAVRIVVSELTKFAERIAVFQEVSNSSQELVTDLPRQFISFVSGLSELVNSVAEPRRHWLMTTEERARQTRTLLDNTLVFQRSVQATLEEVTTTLRSLRDNLTSNQERLTDQERVLREQIPIIEREIEQVSLLEARARQSFRERELRLQQRAVENQRVQDQLIAENRRLDTLQEELNRQEAEIRARQAEQAMRRRRLEDQQSRIVKEISNENIEQAALKRIAEVEIPAAEKELQIIQSQTSKLRSERFVEKLAELKTRHQLLQNEFGVLCKEQRELNEMTVEMEKLQQKESQLRNEVEKLHRQKIEEKINVLTGKISDMESFIENQPKIKLALENGRSSFQIARDTLNRTSLAREVKELNDCTNRYWDELTALESDFSKLSNNDLINDLEQRYASLKKSLILFEERLRPHKLNWYSRFIGFFGRK